MSTSQPDLDNSSSSLSSQVILSCVKLTIKTNYHTLSQKIDRVIEEDTQN